MPDQDSSTPAIQYREKRYAIVKSDPALYAVYLERKRRERHARQIDTKYERERKRKWRAANKEKDRLHHDAHHAVENAIRKGTLTRPKTCEACGAAGKIEAHHHLGYEQAHWLDVQWLCQMCHAKKHREIRGKEDTDVTDVTCVTSSAD